MHAIHCPTCDRILLDTAKNGTHKLRTKMVLFDGTKALALCPQCKTEVPVPVRLDAQAPTLKHVIRKPSTNR